VSKCLAVLDGEKITDIQVKTKEPQETAVSEPKVPDVSERVPATETQQSK